MYLEEFEQEFEVDSWADQQELAIVDLAGDDGELVNHQVEEPEEVLEESKVEESKVELLVKPGRKGSKMSQARLIYKREFEKGGPVKRATMIVIFMDEIGISHSCASTYFQTISKEF